MRRWLGDLLRALANQIDEPKLIKIAPGSVVVRVDGRQIAEYALASMTLKRTPRHVTLFERIIGHIFGWL